MSCTFGEKFERISPIKAYREAGKLNLLIQLLSRRGVPVKELKPFAYCPAIGGSFVKAVGFVVGLAVAMELLKASPYLDPVRLLAVIGYVFDYLRSQRTHMNKVEKRMRVLKEKYANYLRYETN